MGLSRQELADEFSTILTAADVAGLETHGTDDETIYLLGMEHVSRSLAVLRAGQDLLLSRNLLLMAANEFITAAQGVNAQLKKEPTLALVD